MQEMQETWAWFLVEKIPWTRKWQPTLVFLPRKFNGQKSLACYSPWVRKESNRTEHAHTMNGYLINTCLCCAESLSHVWLFANLWTVARQGPLSMGILQARILEWVAMLSSRGSSQPRYRTQVSRIQAYSLPSEPPGKLRYLSFFWASHKSFG